MIGPGHCSIRQALDFLTAHVNDPTASGSIDSIARKYKLDKHRVRTVVDHFQVFNIYVPKNLADGAKPQTDSVNLLEFATMFARRQRKPKNIESGKQAKEEGKDGGNSKTSTGGTDSSNVFNK